MLATNLICNSSHTIQSGLKLSVYGQSIETHSLEKFLATNGSGFWVVER